MTSLGFKLNRFSEIDTAKHRERLACKFTEFAVLCPPETDIESWQTMLNDRRQSWIQKTLSFVLPNGVLQRKGGEDCFLPSPEALEQTIFRESTIAEVSTAVLEQCDGSNFLEKWNPVAYNLVILLEQSRVHPTNEINQMAVHQRNRYFAKAWNLCFGNVSWFDFSTLNVLSLLEFWHSIRPFKITHSKLRISQR